MKFIKVLDQVYKLIKGIVKSIKCTKANKIEKSFQLVKVLNWVNEVDNNVKISYLSE